MPARLIAAILLLAALAAASATAPPPVLAQAGGQAGYPNGISTVATDNYADVSIGITPYQGSLADTVQNITIRYRVAAAGATPAGQWQNTNCRAAGDFSQTIPNCATGIISRSTLFRVRITGLTPATTYDIQAATWWPAFPLRWGLRTATNSFTTTSVPPSVSGITYSDRTQTSATATVSISNAGGKAVTVYFRARRVGSSSWGPTVTRLTSTATNSAEFPIVSLTAGATYETQAATNSSFSSPYNGATFTTTAAAAIANIAYSNRAQTSATATVSISNAGSGVSRTVYLRIRQSGTNSWGGALQLSTTTSTRAFSLTGLTPGTTYQAQAALNSSFSAAYTGGTFTTLTSGGQPGTGGTTRISRITPGNVSHNAIRLIVSIENADGSSRRVYLRWRVSGSSDAWQTADESTSTDNVTFSLSDLLAATSYTVEGSFNSAFPAGTDTLVQPVSTAAAPESLLTLNVSVRLEPDPSSYRYSEGDSRTFQLVGESSFFPVSISTHSVNIRLAASQDTTCAGGGSQITNLARGASFAVLVCADVFGNALLLVNESGGDERQLARYNLPLDKRGALVTVPVIPIIGVDDPTQARDAIGLSILINSLCELGGFYCDTTLLANLLVLSFAGAAFVIPTVYSLQTGFPVGTIVIGLVLAVITLTLGYLLAGLPLWIAAGAVLLIAMMGFLAIGITIKALGRT